MKNIGIILAGGSGHRMGNSTPKQFLLLAGKTILEHSVSAFQNHPDIDYILVVTHADYINQTREILKHTLYPKVLEILSGGNERYHSTLAALKACPATDCKLIIHDAVRPFVSQTMITDCIRCLDDSEACTVAIPTTDTILVSDPTHTYIGHIPTRHFLFNVQTPQGFRKSTLTQAYQIATQDSDFQPTDDCGVISKYLPGIQIKIVPGSASNLKITYPEDLTIAGQLLSTNVSKSAIQ